MEYLEKFQQKLDSLLEVFKGELITLRSNRPTPKLIEGIKVDYMDQLLTVKQVGSISIEMPKDLLVTVWDKGAVSPTTKAIEAANLGVSVSSQGTVIRVKLPDLTSERKQELIKVIKSSAEEVRIRMRRERDVAHKKVNEEQDKDQKFRFKDELQKKVDKFNESIEELVENKAKEILK